MEMGLVMFKIKRYVNKITEYPFKVCYEYTFLG